MQVWIKDYDTKSDILKRSKKNEYPVGWVGKIGAHWTLFIKAYEMLLDVFELDAIKNENCYKLKPVL